MADKKVHLNIILNQVKLAESLASSTFDADDTVVLVLKNAVESLTLLLGDASTSTATPPVAPKATPEVISGAVPATPIDPAFNAGVNVDENVAEVENDAEAATRGLLNDLNGEINMAGLAPDEFFKVMNEVPEEIAQIFYGNENADEDGEGVNPLEETGIHGVIENENGEFVEVGNFDDHVDRLTELLDEVEQGAEAEGFDGLPEPEHAVNIRYTRLDGNPLTVDDTMRILDHPVSRPLHRLGGLRFNSILQTDDPATTIARYEIENPTRTVLTGMAMGAVQYAGIKVFPGLGQVQATGYVNFDI